MAALLESEGPAGPPVPAFFDDTTPMSGPQLSTPGAGPFLLSPRDYLADMLKAFDFCLPTTGKAVPDRPDWLHEIKYDGDRFRLEPDGVRVRSITFIGPP